MAESFVSGVGATGMEMTGGGEHVASRYRAPHPSPHPLISKAHPAAHRAPAPHHRTLGTHRRGTIVAGGNPATIQLEGQDVAYTVPLAQHVTTGMISAGGTVIVAMFDESNPVDAVIVAAY
jgi:hypothetical protein